MAMTSSSGSGAVATGREVSISVLDATGTPVADANVRLYVDGTFYGQALTRSGSLRPITLSIEDATASVRVVVDVPGHLPREAVLDPGRNDAHFVYQIGRAHV